MSDAPPGSRTFDREEVAQILREAARIDDSDAAPAASASLGVVSDGGLTLAEIERAASEVGIARSAVSTASLRIALRAVQAGTNRSHLVHEVPGTLSDERLDQLVSDIRAFVGPSTVRRTPDGVEVEIGKPGGQPGSLLVQVRTRAGSTTVSLWSAAPELSVGDLASCATLGVPAFLFPVVAVSGGQWPAIASATTLAAIGAAAGAGIGLAANRWRMDRWRARVERVVMPIAARTSALAVAREAGPSVSDGNDAPDE